MDTGRDKDNMDGGKKAVYKGMGNTAAYKACAQIQVYGRIPVSGPSRALGADQGW
ncbi:MAG: hypothetical protein ACM3X9_09325 [Bacillota bacterium]